MKKIKKCVVCRTEFFVAKWNKDRKYCSHKCYWKNKIGTEPINKNQEERKCFSCNKIFYITKNSTKKYCSNVCYWRSKKGTKTLKGYRRKILLCPFCKQKFEVIKSSKKTFCSRECYFSMFKKIIKCKTCKKTIKINHSSKRKFCSLKCAGKFKKGKKLSAEHIKKLSISHIGQKSFKKGKNFDEQYGEERAVKIKNKIRKTLKEKKIIPKSAFKKGHNTWNKNRKWEDMFGENESLKRKLKWRTYMNKNVKVPLKDSKPELKMHDILDRLKINYKKHVPITNIKHFYQCDVFIKPNIIVEVDGKYWHNYPNGRAIDKTRTKELILKGYVVFRFWEGEFNFNIVKEKLSNIVNVIDTIE